MQEDESDFSTILPVDDTTTERKQPWLLHSLAVNALNFCSFAMYHVLPSQNMFAASDDGMSILVATPGVQDGHVM